jgi:hypothetical protein
MMVILYMFKHHNSRAVVGVGAAQPATSVNRMLSSLKVKCPLYSDDGWLVRQMPLIRS